MALAIDLTRAAASPAARLSLVQAIVAAPPHEPETDYVEWKSRMDLQHRHERAEAATYILSFANREPPTAMRHLDGHGYLVIAAEPGKLIGLQPIDSAKLVTLLEPYVGGIGAGPQWDIDWVEISGTHVLVITVAPPRDGDPPWPVRKEFSDTVNGRPSTIRNGGVYVRRNGMTVEANAAELDMLAARARGSASRTHVAVQPAAGRRVSVQPVDASDEEVETYLSARRRQMMKSLEDHQQAARATVTYDPTAVATDLQRTLAKIAAATQGLSTKEPDPRAPAEFTAEVDTYIDALRKQMPYLVCWLAIKTRPQKLALQLRNLTDHNFRQVEVMLHIGGSIQTFDTIPPPPDLPSLPRPYGPMRIPSIFDDIRLGSSFRLPSEIYPSIHSVDVTPRPRIRNDRSSNVEYPAINLRPRAVEPLEELYILAGVRDAGSSVGARWEATSTSASGRPEGSFDIDVLPDALHASELLGTDGEDPRDLIKAAQEDGGDDDADAT